MALLRPFVSRLFPAASVAIAPAFFGAAMFAACGGSSGDDFAGGSPDAAVDDAAAATDTATSHDTGAATDGRTGGGADGSPGSDAASSADGSADGGGDRLQTIFLIMMENHSWSTIKSNAQAPYINSLLAVGGHAEQYFTPPKNHPSEPNYIWLESGDNLGITSDDPPSKNHQSVTNHLVTMLDAAKIPWKAYAEDIDGTACPLTDSGKFAVRHTPMVFFDDVTNTNDAASANCIAHVRPYTELATDISTNKVARYNFITPNLCDDMHGLALACGTNNFNEISAGDTWLKTEIPKIMASDAYKKNGVIFVVWDEGDTPFVGTASDGPLPFFVLSPKAKVAYTSQTKLTHSSMLRTVQEILGVSPLLRDAASATDLSEFFTSFP